MNILTVKEVSSRLKGRVVSDIERASHVSRPTIQKIIDNPDCKVNKGTLLLLTNYLKKYK